MSGNKTTFFIETFGCQMNERDSQTIGGLLIEAGFLPGPNAEDSDVVIINTCSVRHSAEQKVWSRLGRIASRTKGGRSPIIVLAGCMAQLPENIQRIKERVPYVNIVVGPGHINNIAKLVTRVINKQPRKLLTAISPNRTEAHRTESTQMLPEALPRIKVPGVSAYVTIIYGCDNFCTYCIVPFVRGPQVSRQPKYIIEEVEQLISQGYDEIILLGQNVNAYGYDLSNSIDFAQLLEKLDEVEEINRIRYFTSHPKDFTKAMVDTVKNSKHICEHFHLPFQSGSDRLLKLMHRGYTRGQYLDLVGYIKTQMPYASITTDIIVGFPGETEADFEDTIDLVQQAKLDGAFTFMFSPRSGTAAARMKEQIPKEIKSRRLQKLVEIQNGITKSINESLIDTVQEVLVEGVDLKNPKYVRGRTRTNKLVVCTSNQPTPGDVIKVKINEAGTWYLKGPLLEKN